ncbi:MAG TPA: acyl-ACP--UDP-N-acetylglucosamine O-acyltransferase [Acidobacteriota bacterium]|jgi:UDP-N-acetylglucosamine acyltransferase|nr:acyl-ACP--UDP-N-acetylglucosamine O-acyltransferase [Acidobacteriota bacterium]
MNIHPTAIIDPSADIASDVSIDAYVIIGARVKIAAGTRIGPYVRVEGPTEIGAGCKIYSHCSIGSDAQDLKFEGEIAYLKMGKNNLIREFVTINRGTKGGGGYTILGDDNYLMTGVHVAHDCRVGNGTILANAATLAGHVTIEDNATVGAFSGVHQFCRVGSHAYVGGYSVITRDALPFVKTVGSRNEASTYGINTLGLERRSFRKEEIQILKKAYRILIQSQLQLKGAVEKLRQEFPDNPHVRALIRFASESDRGFIR